VLGTSLAALQRGEIDGRRLQLFQLIQQNFAQSSLAIFERKPTFGRRRCIGIWPPSKPALILPLPVRAYWPLWPRPAGLAQTGTDAATDATRFLAGALGGFERIETHEILLARGDYSST
jgi:hypothetical protein